MTSQQPPEGEITREEFCRRFTAEMVRLAGPSYTQLDENGEAAEEGLLTVDYAAEAAPTYFDEPDQRAEGPEACAQADYGYWE